MLKLIGTVEKGQSVLVCVAGNLCSPEVFDQVKLPGRYGAGCMWIILVKKAHGIWTVLAGS